MEVVGRVTRMDCVRGEWVNGICAVPASAQLRQARVPGLLAQAKTNVGLKWLWQRTVGVGSD